MSFDLRPASIKSRRLPREALDAARGVNIPHVHRQFSARIGIAAREAWPADHIRRGRQGYFPVTATDTDNRVRLRRGVHETGIVRPVAHVEIDQRGFYAELLALLDCEHGINRVVAAVDAKHERALRTQSVDILAIDGRLAQSFRRSPEDGEKVRRLVEQAQRLGGMTCAEWVDDPSLARALALAGIDYIEGPIFPAVSPMAGRQGLAARG